MLRKASIDDPAIHRQRAAAAAAAMDKGIERSN
jgi:hypothetical protein